jgi:ketosteroid isomerase-like protein
MTLSAVRSESSSGLRIASWFSKRGLTAALIAAGVCVGGCRSPADTAQAELLLKADQDFAAMAEKSGAPAAYMAFLSPDAVELPSDTQAVAGIAAISDRQRKLAPNRLHWRPQRAEAARDGSVGWTWGEWTLTPPAASALPLRRGKYMHTWRRQPDGRWKVVADIRNTAYEEPPAEVTPPPVPAQPRAVNPDELPAE